MDPQPPNYNLWTVVIAGLTLCSGLLAAAWHIVRAPLVRLALVEDNVRDLARRQDNSEKGAIVNNDALQALHTEHGRLREMLAAQPTKEDLRHSEERITASVDKSLRLVIDTIGGRKAP